jgi:3D-(3,5/4)-trihydroxycyclohexane-1,2-dione acylhydrolase (decyclizing)
MPIRLKRAPPFLRSLASVSSAERPLLIAGGGVQYSRAAAALADFARAHDIPVVETIAGRANLVHGEPLNIGPIGVTGSASANALAARADVVVAAGNRLQDFTTGSWTAFAREARILSINVGRFDASKHLSLPGVADARLALEQLNAALGDYRAPRTWVEMANQEKLGWGAYVEADVSGVSRKAPTGRCPTRRRSAS